jgi:hypothetical protein
MKYECEYHIMNPTGALRQVVIKNEDDSIKLLSIQKLWVCRNCGLKVWKDLPVVRAEDVSPVPENCGFSVLC